MMIQRKGLVTRSKLDLKENLKLINGGPSHRQASGTNQRIIALRQGRQ